MSGSFSLENPVAFTSKFIEIIGKKIHPLKVIIFFLGYSRSNIVCGNWTNHFSNFCSTTLLPHTTELQILLLIKVAVLEMCGNF